MKKIILSMLLMGICVSSFAQHETGTVTLQPKVGLNIASITDVDDADPRFGVAVGAELEYQISDIFSISGGALYSMQGFKGNSSEVDETLKLDYINIPIMANVYVVKGLAVKAGIQPGFNVNCKISGSVEGHSASADFGGYVKTFDFSIPVGLSYEYRNFVLDARYNFGLTKIFKEVDVTSGDIEIDTRDIKSKNSVFQITLGYKFEL